MVLGHYRFNFENNLLNIRFTSALNLPEHIYGFVSKIESHGVGYIHAFPNPLLLF